MRSPILDHAQRMLKTAVFWFLGCLAIAVCTSFPVQPPVSYTVGAAIIGLAWIALLVVFWRTWPNWSIAAAVILLIALSLLRDFTFPGAGFLRGIYGGAVAIATGMLCLWIFRRQITKFCRLDRDAPPTPPADPA